MPSPSGGLGRRGEASQAAARLARSSSSRGDHGRRSTPAPRGPRETPHIGRPARVASRRGYTQFVTRITSRHPGPADPKSRNPQRLGRRLPARAVAGPRRARRGLRWRSSADASPTTASDSSRRRMRCGRAAAGDAHCGATARSSPPSRVTPSSTSASRRSWLGRVGDSKPGSPFVWQQRPSPARETRPACSTCTRRR
jgi:hypothetical protein